MKYIIFLLTAIVLFAKADDDDDFCIVRKEWNRTERCNYVMKDHEDCEGGGYLKWTQFVECAESNVEQIFVIAGSILYMFSMFVMLKTCGDNYFSPNVAGIVSHLKISESVAGVTFVAFGNGASDLFGSIASILSSPTPKAGLALGTLLGGGMFVLTIVVAVIIACKSFQAEIMSTSRDILFYLVGVVLIFFFFHYDNKVHNFQPAIFLSLYALYVISVLVIRAINRRKKVCFSARSNSTTSSEIGDSPVPKRKCTNKKSQLPTISEEIEHPRFTSPTHEGYENFENPEDEEEELEDVVVVHNIVVVRQDGNEQLPKRRSITFRKPIFEGKSWLKEIVNHLDPSLSDEEWNTSPFMDKIAQILQTIPIILFSATVPLHEDEWSRPVAILYAFLSPQLLLVALKYSSFIPFENSPPLCCYALAFSITISCFIRIFTDSMLQPSGYKHVYSYIGFLMSLFWIYFVATEIVGTITMLGVVSGISYEVLGLTLMAWSNCIGDIVTDTAIVRQGFPRMALAAAIGGPCFNLLVGFGLPFLLATLQGKRVTIVYTPVFMILVVYLIVALIILTIGLTMQRFYVRRPFAVVLVAIYLAFISTVLLTELGTIQLF